MKIIGSVEFIARKIRNGGLMFFLFLIGGARRVFGSDSSFVTAGLPQIPTYSYPMLMAISVMPVWLMISMFMVVFGFIGKVMVRIGVVMLAVWAIMMLILWRMDVYIVNRMLVDMSNFGWVIKISVLVSIILSVGGIVGKNKKLVIRSLLFFSLVMGIVLILNVFMKGYYFD